MRNLLLVVLLFSSLCGAKASSSEDVIYEIKASYLYNFLQFIQFAESTVTENKLLNVCIVGPNRFGEALDEIAGAKTPQATIVVHLIDSYQDISEIEHCQVIYFVGSSRKLSREILAEIDTTKVLTIGEFSDFSRYGGFIELYVKNDSVRFRINNTLAGQTQFKVSAQLLSLGMASR